MVTPQTNKEEILYLEEFRMFISGMDYKQIAVAHAISLETARHRIRTAYKRLVEILDNNKIPYPCQKYGGIKTQIAQQNYKFWLTVIDDYEQGWILDTKKPKIIDTRINSEGSDRAFRNYSFKTKGFVDEKDKECWDSAIQWTLNRLRISSKILQTKEKYNESRNI